MENAKRIVGVIDIIFSTTVGQERGVYIRGGDGNVYPTNAKIEGALRQATYSEMREIVGAGAVLEMCAKNNAPPAYVVTAFIKTQHAGNLRDDVEDDPTLDAWLAERTGANAPHNRPASSPKAVLDRYGLAVEIIDAELFVFPINRFGAISPIETRVTRPSPEFLADVNAKLGTSLTLADFPASIAAAV